VLDAGIVHQHVDGAELVDGPLHHRLDRLLLREVGTVVAHRSAELGSDLCAQPRDRGRLAEAVEDHVRALGGERACDAETDAARRAGHQRSPAFQHGSPVGR
jgi:hypothetical protein